MAFAPDRVVRVSVRPEPHDQGVTAWPPTWLALYWPDIPNSVG
ncbi:hypothetical protein [Nocardia sp. NPDC004604]